MKSIGVTLAVMVSLLFSFACPALAEDLYIRIMC
jgi:hypothetical protein